MAFTIERGFAAGPGWTLRPESHRKQKLFFGGFARSREGSRPGLGIYSLRNVEALRREAPPTPVDSTTGRKRVVERIWRDFFSDSSQWWDNRSEKVNARYPDFKHKSTRAALWLNSELTPSWVEAALGALPPGTVHADLFSRNKSLTKCVKSKQYEETLRIFHQMLDLDMGLNSFTIVPVLNACAALKNLEEGKLAHAQAIKHGCESDMFVGNSLMDMYAKCGELPEAQKVFEKMPKRNAYSWNAIILGHVKGGQGQKALGVYKQMQEQGRVEPDSVTYIAALKACAALGALEEGRNVHQELTHRGWDTDAFVGSSLLDMYAKCGTIREARTVFDGIPARDAVCWSAMILGYVRCGQAQQALDLHREMGSAGVGTPNAVAFAGLLSACASLSNLDHGKNIHAQVAEAGLAGDAYVGSSLIDMYAKCGSIAEAQRVLDEMPGEPNSTAWAAMILGLAECGQGAKALELSREMRARGVDPEPATYAALLAACASVGMGAIEQGKQVHEEILRSGLEADALVRGGLVDMYSKCGSMDDSRRVLDGMSARDTASS